MSLFVRVLTAEKERKKTKYSFKFRRRQPEPDRKESAENWTAAEVTTEMTGEGQQNEKEKFLSCVLLLCCQIRRIQLENPKTANRERERREKRKQFSFSVYQISHFSD